MGAQAHMNAETRIALLFAMGRFVIDLDIMQCARLGPMSMDGWSEADHGAAREWAAAERHRYGSPPPKVADYLRELRTACGAVQSPDLTPEAVAAVWEITPARSQS